ncbi:hypothetical protein OSB04_002677 [Centaurea solstitialis]|uniref:Arogenate dehydratase n=1 Tax=Centaurea solstitialis TaxID=347529 RepID=A0AA38U3W8_9ASTR|nr:hypothetical protein OSB04_002677 [Centaurea solstitialis]
MRLQFNNIAKNLQDCRVHLAKFKKWECLALKLAEPERAQTHVEDETPSDLGSTSTDERIGDTRSPNQKEPLSAMDLASSGNDGSKVRVAYQGLPGAYSEAAALKAYPKCETVPCDQFESVFKAVELWLVDKAVLPIENSMVVNHCLLGVPGVKKEELKRVLSHPQALDQCEIALNKLGVMRVSAEDSAGAAQIVASEGIRDTGAVASSRAAEIYGLDILAQTIQDDLDNVTRFLILAREPIIPGPDKPYKTSIVFTLEEGPGVLFKALAVFALREINLSKIESRPQRKRPLRIVDDSNKGSAKYFDYLFYIDFEASMAEPRAQYALGHLQVHPSYLFDNSYLFGGLLFSF